MDWRDLPGLRVLARLGPGRLVTAFMVVVAVLSVAAALFQWRPDLLRPGDIGTDASNYYAAALRILDGHPLYALSAGDRPVPADNPPLWSVPLLSPPPMAVMWLPLAALLPGVVAMYAWWLTGLAGTLLTGIAVAMRRSPWVALAGMVLAPAIAITAVSGNVNALVVPGLAAVFALADRPQTSRIEMVIALLAGSMAAAKLGPVLVIWWLFVHGRARAAALALVVTGGLLAATIAAGTGVLGEYVEISRQTAIEGATALSATTILASLGAPPSIASIGPMLCLAAAAIAAVVLRRTPLLTRLAITLGIVCATPVVRLESFAVVAAALAMSAPRLAGTLSPRRVVTHPAALALGVALTTGIAAWMATGPSSAVTLQNDWGEPVVLRFGAAWQDATFGFRVEPGLPVRAFGPLPGALTGSLVVYDLRCHPLATLVAPRTGGHIRIGPDGGVGIVQTPDSDVLNLAAYDPACSGP